MSLIPIRILAIDDQDIVHAAIKNLIDQDKNLSFSFCKNPLQAVEIASEVKPTVILLDLVMPEIDGMLVLKYLKEAPSIKDIPVIVLSVQEDAEVKAQAFSLGAADFMVKFPQPLEFCSRLHYHANNYLADQNRRHMFCEMSKNKKVLEDELRAATNYLMSTLPKPVVGKIECDWRYIPSLEIGGDLFGYRWLDDGHFAFFIFDVSGHGIRAALHSNSLFFALQSIQAYGIDPLQPQAVLTHMNKTFQMDQYDNTFFTMWYGVYCEHDRLLTYSSGGHPPAIALMPNTRKKEELLYTHGMALGVDPHSQYEAFSIEVAQGTRIYLFSDGIFELSSSRGRRMTFEQFVTLLKQPAFPGVKDLDRIIHNTELFREGQPFDDDVCLLQFDFT